MAITDNRTQITNANTTTGFVDAAGAAAGNQDTETFILGSASVSEKSSNSTITLLYNHGASTDFSNQTFYFWWNVASAGLLGLRTAGGVRIRFAGSTISNWFEYYIAGADTYSGGWTMTPISIEQASALADATNGTKPATSAIQYTGLVFDTTAMVTGNTDNVFVDAMWRLPQNTPGIIVAGQDGTNAWDWSDIVLAGDIGDTTKAWGTIRRENGIIFVNTPIQFGVDDTAADSFADTDKVIAWEDQLVDADLYQLSMVAGTGTQSFLAGTKVGTGDDAIGQQGWVITAASTGVRWGIDATDTDLDEVQFLGCAFFHGGTFSVNNANAEFRSCQISDVSSFDQSGSTFQKNTILSADTTSGEAFLFTNNLTDLKDNSFVASSGHAIQIDSTGTYTFTGNSFSGYDTTNGTGDTAIYNTSGGLVTINIGGGGDTPTYTNDGTSSTVVNNNTSVTVAGLVDNTEVRIYRAGTTTVIGGIEDATDGTTNNRSYTFSDAAAESVDIVIHHINYVYIKINSFTIPATDTSIPIQQRFDRNYSNP